MNGETNPITEQINEMLPHTENVNPLSNQSSSVVYPN